MESVLIPQNKYGIIAGHYTINGIVKLLRAKAYDPAAVKFIADMLER